MFRPTGFADLAGKRVGIFGYGLEGHAAERRLLPLTSDVVIVDDDPHEGRALASAEGGLEALATCDVVLKSPGIPRRRHDVIELEDRGVTVTSALNLWLHDVDRSRVIAITGTKGKSTTTSLVAFFLRCVGEEAQELGNFGTAPYDPDVDVDVANAWLVLEVSSYQSVDLSVAPALVVVTSLGADHLDWHGNLEQYHHDKLTITRASGEHVTLVADTPELVHALALIGGRLRVVRADASGLSRELGLLGAHNDHNVALALAACAQATGRDLDDVRAAVAARAHDFVPLRGRLTRLGTRATTSGTILFVDDGLATGPLPTMAALAVVADDDVALIAGGFDRGVDYSELAATLHQRARRTTLVVMGPAGQRLARLCVGIDVIHAADMAEAVRSAVNALPHDGVILFSPAAPSFDAYQNWSERSDDFAAAAQSFLIASA